MLLKGRFFTGEACANSVFCFSPVCTAVAGVAGCCEKDKNEIRQHAERKSFFIWCGFLKKLKVLKYGGFCNSWFSG
jgi:hypothetical protein